MKLKKLLVIGLVVFAFPVIGNAKVCTAVSGTGKDIGDEIACGSEHFYVLENKDNKIKMLSKYNLYVGDKIEKDEKSFLIDDYLEEESPDSAASDAANARCEYLKTIYGEDNVKFTLKFSETGETSEYFCRIYTPLEYNEVKQSEKAIGLFPNKNKEILYPIYGSVNLDEEVGEKEFDENMDMIPETSQFNEYLEEYTKTLNGIGVNVLDIGYIKKSGVEKLINTVSDKKIDISSYNPWDADDEFGDNIWGSDGDESGWYDEYFMPVIKFNIKEYVPEKYTWLYGTTYWVGSATKNIIDDDYIEYFDEFLSSVGDYCSYQRGCTEARMGIGLRPVVTINSADLVIEKQKKESIVEEINPDTGDKILSYVIVGGGSLLVLLFAGYQLSKKHN